MARYRSRSRSRSPGPSYSGSNKRHRDDDRYDRPRSRSRDVGSPSHAFPVAQSWSFSKLTRFHYSPVQRYYDRERDRHRDDRRRRDDYRGWDDDRNRGGRDRRDRSRERSRDRDRDRDHHRRIRSPDRTRDSRDYRRDRDRRDRDRERDHEREDSKRGSRHEVSSKHPLICRDRHILGASLTSAHPFSHPPRRLLLPLKPKRKRSENVWRNSKPGRRRRLRPIWPRPILQSLSGPINLSFHRRRM